MTEDVREKSTGRRGGALGDRSRLVLASFLMLFVELALIRWTAANDIFLASTGAGLDASLADTLQGFRAAAGARRGRRNHAPGRFAGLRWLW